MASSEPLPVLASALCAGRIGWIKLAGPFIRVSVYADRMTVRYFGMGERTICGRDISMVREGSQWGRPLIVEHTAGWWSPLVLFVSDEVKAAILRVKRDQPRREGPPEEFWYS
jgi:hypothetical protein